MSDIPVLDSGQAPTIPARVRTWAYLVALCAGGAGSTVVGVTAAVAPHAAGTVGGIVGAVLGGISMVAGGLGVAYRPSSLTGR